MWNIHRSIEVTRAVLVDGMVEVGVADVSDAWHLDFSFDSCLRCMIWLRCQLCVSGTVIFTAMHFPEVRFEGGKDYGNDLRSVRTPTSCTWYLLSCSGYVTYTSIVRSSSFLCVHARSHAAS